MQYKKLLKLKIDLYIYGIFILSLIFSVVFGISTFYMTGKNILFGILETFLIFIPFTEILTKVVQNILSKCVKPKPIPKMDFSEGVPKEYSTIIAIPSILKNEEDVKKIFNKLEVYYLANKSENIYCLALGDCTSSTKETEDVDNKIIDTGLLEIERLNKKYGEKIFNFIYRKRLWNEKEKCFMGWERKRGLLTELNQFLNKSNYINSKENGSVTDNPVLLDKFNDIEKHENSFLVNTLKEDLHIKYVITLDSDTELTLNSGIELIEAMAHPLNKPEIENKKVVSGYRNYTAKSGNKPRKEYAK